MLTGTVFGNYHTGRLVTVGRSFVWVCCERLKTLSLTSEQWFLSHYRDKDQVEVDFVVASPLRAILAIEVKSSGYHHLR